MDGVLHQLVHALVLGRRDGDDGDAQHLLHGVYVDKALVPDHLVHHVQGQNHGHVHLQQLHGEIQVALDVGGIHNVDDGPGLLLQHKVPGDDLLAAVGGHGVDTRQVGDQGVGIAKNGPVLSVHRHAGKVAHMLAGAGELVK